MTAQTLDHRVAGIADTDLVAMLDEAGLTGRGGAAFSTARKLEVARRHDATLIVNACDGELDAAKDAWVVECHLDELRHGAALIGAPRIRYAAHRDSPTSAQLRAAGLDVLEVPRRYVSSEESSLARLAAGGTARPVAKTRLLMAGTHDAQDRRVPPTVVFNAETVLRIGQLHLWGGPRWFRSFGTADEPGPRLVTVVGAVAEPGVIEAEAGVPLRRLLDLAGGVGSGPGRPIALEINGLGGGWLTWAQAHEATWSTAYLRRFGLTTGAAVLRVHDASSCPVEHVLARLDYAAGESAGQCGPCMFGVPAVAADLRALADGDANAAPRLTTRLAQLPGRGACRFPDGVAGYAASALRVFADHWPDHHEPCRASAGTRTP